jgi:hypothetical protein
MQPAHAGCSDHSNEDLKDENFVCEKNNRRKNNMSEETNKISRREALGTLGTVLAATAVVGLVSETAQAQAQAFDMGVDKYVVLIYSSPLSTQDSRIKLTEATGKFCNLYFMKAGQAIPTNTIAADLLSAKVYFPQSRYMEIRDFLRYEKPVIINVSSNGTASIENGVYELVGDLDI